MGEYFLETRDVFQLKDLEKSMPKLKGITAQTVKEVLQSLVDDRIVNGERIGISNYFWSFPSMALKTRTARIQALSADIEKLAKVQGEAEGEIALAANMREDVNDRPQKLARLAAEEGRLRALQEELDQFREMDPDLFAERKGLMKKAKEGCDRWTDNVFTLQSHCAATFNIQRSDFFSQFGISEEFDYVA